LQFKILAVFLSKSEGSLSLTICKGVKGVKSPVDF
jgi:hypothetical protein